MIRDGIPKAFSFSILSGADGRWRNSVSTFRYASRLEAWRAGMEIVRRKLDELQSRRPESARGRFVPS